MNRLTKLLKEKRNNNLAIYFTAGFPQLDDTVTILKSLEQGGADLVEIGIPFSDPLADGPTIQDSSQKALENGMSLRLLFQQLKDIRKEVTIPIVLMGYLNPVMKFGFENFLKECSKCGIDGVILPDLPLNIYEKSYKNNYLEAGVSPIFLITPQTSPERIQYIDSLEGGFIYVVSSAATTGKKGLLSQDQEDYLNQIQEMGLKTPQLVGFGIHDRETFEQASHYSQGAIIGSEFIREISNCQKLEEQIPLFISKIKKQ